MFVYVPQYVYGFIRLSGIHINIIIVVITEKQLIFDNQTKQIDS